MTDQKITGLTRSRIGAYADAVDDHNPMHIDDEFARASGLPSVIAHGPLTVAVALDALLGGGSAVPKTIEARLKAPVFPDEELALARTDDGLELRKADGTPALAMTVSLQ